MTNFPHPRKTSNENVVWKENEKDKDKNSDRYDAICVFYRGTFQRRAISAEMIESSLFPTRSIGHSQLLVTVNTADDIENP